MSSPPLLRPSTALTTAAPFTSSVSWHLALSHKDGRDRLFRLIQYTLRLLRGLSNGRTVPTTSPFAQLYALESALAAARQAFRLFKWSGFYSTTSIRDVLNVPPRIPTGNALTSAIASAQDGFLALYLALDNYAFLTKTSVIRGDASAATRNAARAWFVASMLGLVNCVRRWHSAGRAGDGKAAPPRARRERARRHAVLAAKYGGDAVIAWSLTGGGGGGGASRPAHPALVGACGLASSLVMFADVWPRGAAAAESDSLRGAEALARTAAAEAAVARAGDRASGSVVAGGATSENDGVENGS